MPLSASVVVTRDEILELLRRALDGLPDELVGARRVLKERDAVLDGARAEGDAIVREASARAERLVQRTEVVRSAEETARLTIAGAEADARRLRFEVEDFCDQRLASFEAALDEVAGAVARGRRRLQGGPPGPGGTAPTRPPEAAEAREGGEQLGPAPFDQDDR